MNSVTVCGAVAAFLLMSISSLCMSSIIADGGKHTLSEAAVAAMWLLGFAVAVVI